MKSIGTMKKGLLLMALIVPFSVSAQIKKADPSMVAGGNSAREKVYSEVATQFVRYSPEKMLYLNDVICPGERVYILEHTLTVNASISYNGKFERVDGTDAQEEGYYRIENIFLTKESLSNHPYEKELLKVFAPNSGTYSLPSINKLLSDLEGRKSPYLLHSNALFELVSEGNGKKYYTQHVERALPVRSYEYHSELLSNRDIRLVVKRSNEFEDITNQKKSLTDAITEDYVPINSSQYRCVDFAVKDSYGTGYGAVQMVVILENNGNRFALRIVGINTDDYGIVYETSQDDVYFMTEDTYKKMKTSVAQRKKEYETELKRAAAERKREMIARYGEVFGTKICEGKIALGMSEEMVLTSWGFPETTFNHTNSSGQFTVWSYGLNTYISFANDKVTSITNGFY